MINGSFEISQSSDSGNQLKEEENKENGIKQSRNNRNNSIEIEIEKGEIVLDGFIKNIVEENRKQYPNFPLERSGNISMWEIMEQKGLSEEERKKIKEEIQEASETEKGMKREIGGTGVERRQSETLLMAIIHKVIGEQSCVFRASLYDDLFNGVDIIIADQIGKEPICVLNVTVFQKGGGKKQQEIVDKRKRTAYEKNLSGGAELKFFGLEERKKSNIPIFCFPLDKEKIVGRKKRSGCLNNFIFPLSKRELDIFNIFITSIEEQISEYKKIKKNRGRKRDQLIERQVIKLEGIGQSTKKDIAKLEEESQSINGQIAKLKKEARSTEGQITESKKSKIPLIKKKTRGLESKSRSTEGQITELEKESRSIKGQIAKLDRKVRSIQRQVTELKSKSQPSLDLLGNQMSSLETKIGEWKDSYEKKLVLVEGTNKKPENNSSEGKVV